MASKALDCHWVPCPMWAVSLYSCEGEGFLWEVSYKKNMFYDFEKLALFLHISAEIDSDLYCRIGQKFLSVAVDKFTSVKVKKRAFALFEIFAVFHILLRIELNTKFLPSRIMSPFLILLC